MVTKLKLIFTLFLLSINTYGSEVSMKNIYHIMEKYDLPGLAFGILNKDGDLSVTAYGMRDNEKDERVTASDSWHIGSCTKSMTATLVAIFIEEGKLAWDDKVASFFPEIKVHEKLKNTTLVELLAHQSGIGPVSEELFKKLSGDPIKARLMVVEEALGSTPRFPQGEENYANPNYIIAGAILEKLSNTIFEELMKEKLFKPLGMNSCGFGAPGSGDVLDAPRGHRRDGDKLISIYGDNPTAYSPAGRVHCSLKDWGNYAYTHLKGLRGEDTPILKASSFKRLHEVLGNSDYTPGGWVIMTEKWSQGPLLWHNGSNTLFMAHIWIAPHIGKAFLLATNVGGEESEKALVEVMEQLVKSI
ncbi:MAG: class A beta-lactamase-related serine hydrolase [Deltaproteobacteria bacterium]|nr:MAG: class A beta-lactamase-related serine hydrolase [Deltaproteobacteria bacterium]